MTVPRVCALLGIFALLALAVVYLRTEQARCAARALALESTWIEMRRELWSLQTTSSRLRAPGRIHDRVGWFETGVVPPGMNDMPTRPTRLVSHDLQE